MAGERASLHGKSPRQILSIAGPPLRESDAAVSRSTVTPGARVVRDSSSGTAAGACGLSIAWLSGRLPASGFNHRGVARV